MNQKKIFLILGSLFLLISCSKQKSIYVELKSNYLPSPSKTAIYVPENYSEDNEYPLVILLHGFSGDYSQWPSIFNVQDYANAYEFIFACPDGFYDSWYLNNPFKSDMQYEDFFLNEFIPYLTNNYSVNRNNIFISGLSMGGHGAMNFYLKNPDIFNSAASTAGILDITAFPNNWNIKNGIGTYKDNIELWRKHSAIFLLDSTMHRNKKMLIDCGTSDFAYPVNLNFVKRANELKIPIEFISIPGDHNNHHWRKMIPKHIEFFYNQIQKKDKSEQ